MIEGVEGLCVYRIALNRLSSGREIVYIVMKSRWV